MIYRKSTSCFGLVTFTIGQGLPGTETRATLSKESPFTNHHLHKSRRYSRDVAAKFVREMRSELRRFIEGSGN